MGRMNLLARTDGSNTQFEGFCLIKSVTVKTNVKGASYLDLVLGDGGGEAIAKLWDYSPASHGVYEADDVVKVRGIVTLFKDAEQLKIERIRRYMPGDPVELSALIPCAPRDPQAMYDELFGTAEVFWDDDLRRLVQYLLRENREKLLICPAAVRLHHATRGGLLHHTCTILAMAKRVAEVYPRLDTDLLYTGVILHDVGKLVEMNVGKLGLAANYTTEGELLGHISIGVSTVASACEMLGVPPATAALVEHMLLSHHGAAEFGSPKPPMFPEAEVVSELDLLDSRLYEMYDALDGVLPGAFTDRQWALENRRLYRHAHRESSKETEA